MATERILLIDDLRNFRDGRECVIARTSAEAHAILATNEPFYEIWFDHDLGLLDNGVPDTTMSIVDLLAERAYNDDAYPVSQIYVHTSNSVGSKQIFSSLTNYGYSAVRVYAGDIFIVD